ncbi:MAG: hypothetical protein MI806_20140 [Minwuiales bacterium]|nr:hypothetical protein [Minwuiales bacterium]
MNRDIQDIHFGHINFANALALWLFGNNLVSLRYPLLGLGVLQACLVFFLFNGRGLGHAAVAAVSLTSLSFVQFLNPTAHWYCVFLFVAIIAALSWIGPEHRWRLCVIGFLVGTLILFRQLTGAFVAIGVAAYLMCEAGPSNRDRSQWLPRSVLTGMALLLGAYLATKTDLWGIVGFGIWPLLALALAWHRISIGNLATVRLLAGLTFGAAIAAAPLIAYHMAHGSLGTWFDDTVLAAFQLTSLTFMEWAGFTNMALLAVFQIGTAQDPAIFLNGWFWIALLALPMLTGAAAIGWTWRSEALHPLPFLAPFYALVSVHYQIPIYLFYGVGISLVALLWLSAGSHAWHRALPPVGACAIVIVAIYFHAGQPLTRGLVGTVAGTRIALVPAVGVERANLQFAPSELSTYRQLISLIDRETAPEDAILAIPVNPELYYLTGRRNPFRFFNTALGLTDDEAMRNALAVLEAEPPKLVIHRPEDKYMTPRADTVMDFVRLYYDLIGRIDGFDVYRIAAPK